MDETKKRYIAIVIIVIVFASIFLFAGYKLRDSQIKDIVSAKEHFIESLKVCLNDLETEENYGQRSRQDLRNEHYSYVCGLRNMSYQEEQFFGNCCKKINGTELCVDSLGVEFNYPIVVDFNNFENIHNATVKIETGLWIQDQDYEEIEVTINGYAGWQCDIKDKYDEEKVTRIRCW